MQVTVRTMTGTEVRRTSTDGDWSEMEVPAPEELSETQYPPEILEALKGVRYIASQFKDGDDEVAVSVFLACRSRLIIVIVVVIIIVSSSTSLSSFHRRRCRRHHHHHHHHYHRVVIVIALPSCLSTLLSSSAL